MTRRSRLPCLGILQTLLLTDCNGGRMEKRLQGRTAPQRVRESHFLTPNSAHLLLNVVVWNILKYSVKSRQTANFPSSYVSLPHNGSSLKIKNLQLFEISIYPTYILICLLRPFPPRTLLQYHYLMSHFAYRFWVLKTWPVCLMRQHCVAFKEEHSPIHFWED